MTRHARAPDWRGRVALTLAAGVSVGWSVAVILVVTPWSGPLSAEGAALLSTVGGVIAGACATYLGQQNRQPDITTDTPQGHAAELPDPTEPP
jgi:hypothetical protein